ncbi:glycosyltransferase [Candidatus Omnitrophota bacterium]
MSCDIVIAVWDLKGYTKNCIESIIKNTDYPYRLIVTDNGSQRETKEYLESLKEDPRLKGHDYTLIRNEENLGATKALNQGLEISKGDYAMILNNDTLVTKGWLSEMVKVAESSKEIGIVNPNSNNLGLRRPRWISLEKFSERLMKKYKGQYMEMATAVGFCYMVKREVIERIGILSEEYGLGNFEETEYSIRSARNGYRSVFSRASYVWHKEHASFDLIDDFEEMFEKNQKMFYEMFGKPQRVLYILTRKDEGYLKRLKDITYELAKKCNWIWVISKKSLGKLPLNVHTNIVRFRYQSPFFRIRCVFRVLVRKKRFNKILIDDKVVFWILSALKGFHKARVIEIGKYIYFDDSEFLRLNLGCLGRACYGYVNIDEESTNKRVLKSSFSNLPFDDETVKNILLDYNAISGKRPDERDIIFKELERISVPGCILSIDNFNDDLKDLLDRHNFLAILSDYNKLFSVKSFIYSPFYAKDSINRFLEKLRMGLKGEGTLKLSVPNEKVASTKEEFINFFDKASLAQIVDENGFFIDSLEVNNSSIEATLRKKDISSNIHVPESRKRICAIGQYMLWRYRGLGFDWDAWPRSFERLGMDHLLLEGMRNIEIKKLQKAILSFKPHYLLIVLKDTLPIIRDIKKELKSIGTRVIYWFCDPEHPKKEDYSDIIDTMFLTNRGQLAEYRDSYNLKRVYYMPQGYGPYIQHRLNLPQSWDVGFVGAISDAPLHKTRRRFINEIRKRYSLKASNAVRNNIAEFYSHSKTVFGSSDFDYELYTSNRFFVALGCGACYITKKFKGIELLAENKKHLLWFEDKEELFDILDYYLSHDREREKIRRSAAKLALEKHTYLHRMKNIFDILEGKTENFHGFLS